MGFGDKTLPALGPSLLSLAGSSVAEPITESAQGLGYRRDGKTQATVSPW